MERDNQIILSQRKQATWGNIPKRRNSHRCSKSLLLAHTARPQ